MPEQLLNGKVALVTGGARRIGRGIALSLAEAGADMAITYLTSQAEASATVKEIAARGRRALDLKCDVRAEESVCAMVAEVVGQFGRLDLVVNNAGVFDSGPLDALTVERWDKVFETNVRGPFLVARAALPHLLKTGGRIVNLGSLGGIRAWASHAHYCASKAALHMLTEAMAKAFAPEVSVNCVAPGWIQAGGEDAGLAARLAARTPMARSGTIDDVARAVLFFATGPTFVTGEILTVDGGLGLV
ncbi:MAG TPA: SDR family oxidoreductase [Terracidiphilus sp.]|nr:SDR family oxidoreductase [Terracidiphilus sp.]